MIERAPFVLSLLTITLLPGMIVFILVRRPRQPMTWWFAGVMAGLIVFYLGDLALYRTGLSVMAGLIWQFVSNTGANLTIFSAVMLNILLRERRLSWWEWAATIYIVGRMITVDFIWLPSYLRVDLPRNCQPTPQGLPHLVCLDDGRLAVASGAVTAAFIGILYISTALRAEEPRRHILRRYIVWIVLLIVGGSLMLHSLTLLQGPELGVFPSQPMVLLATVIGLRLFLAVEEQETGIRVSSAGRGALIWLAAMIVAVALDLNSDWFGWPIWTVAVVAVGIAGAGAYLINALLSKAGAAPADEAAAPPAASEAKTAPAAEDSAAEQPPALRIYLLGLMRVERSGALLPNSNDVWRSAKTRSLLAYLALRARTGASQTEIIDVLWPVRPEGDGAAEQRSLTAFRSYLSTLRHVLEPDGLRGSQRFIQQEGSRYFLRRSPEIWVDVWQFDDLAAQAERHWAAGRQEAAVACWEEALALYPPEGLLVDEEHIDSTALEPTRERLRQTWLLGLRRLAKVYAEQGQVERTAELRRALRAAQQLGQER